MRNGAHFDGPEPFEMHPEVMRSLLKFNQALLRRSQDRRQFEKRGRLLLAASLLISLSLQNSFLERIVIEFECPRRSVQTLSHRLLDRKFPERLGNP